MTGRRGFLLSLMGLALAPFAAMKLPGRGPRIDRLGVYGGPGDLLVLEDGVPQWAQSYKITNGDAWTTALQGRGRPTVTFGGNTSVVQIATRQDEDGVWRSYDYNGEEVQGTFTDA